MQFVFDGVQADRIPGSSLECGRNNLDLQPLDPVEVLSERRPCHVTQKQATDQARAWGKADLFRSQNRELAVVSSVTGEFQGARDGVQRAALGLTDRTAV